MTVHSQRLCALRPTKEHISSTSSTSSAWAGATVSARGGVISSFFEPFRQGVAADAKQARNPSHARTFKIGGKNSLLLFLGVAASWLKHTIFAAILAAKLLASTRIMAVFDNVCAATPATFVYNGLDYHACKYTITSTKPLPRINWHNGLGNTFCVVMVAARLLLATKALLLRMERLFFS